MESTMSRAIWIFTLTALFSHTDGQMFLCGSGSQAEMQMRYYDLKSEGFDAGRFSSETDKCLCTVKANGTVHLTSTVNFMTDPDASGENSTCGPLLMVSFEQIQAYVCPTSETNHTVTSYKLRHEEELSIEVINPGKTGIQAIISFDATVYRDSTFNLECTSDIRASTRPATCPCNRWAAVYGGGTGFKASKDVPTGTRVAVALICVAAFLVIFGGLFLLWWKKLRHRNKDEYKDRTDGPPQPVPQAPHMEKGHVNPQFTKVDGDPELNLNMQTPTGSMGSKGLRGSTDSGLYSQGNGQQYYANVPGDHATGLPPDMLYTPGLNLSGHADLQGSGVPRSNRPVDVDALYAKPIKGQGSRSGSRDQLHMQPPQPVVIAPPHPQHLQHPPGPSPEWAVNECYVSDSSHNASQGSLNTSQPAVETDV